MDSRKEKPAADPQTPPKTRGNSPQRKRIGGFADRRVYSRLCTSSSIRTFQFLPSGFAARTQLTASATTS